GRSGARHRLVLVLDQEIFANKEGNTPKPAKTRRLIRNRNCYSGEWDQHSGTIDEFGDASSTITPASKKNGAQIEPLTPRELNGAAKRASRFVQKLTPSTLDADVPVETRASRGRDNLAGLDGPFWHTILQRLDWKARHSSAHKLFERLLPT